jgi:hypothetical protein
MASKYAQGVIDFFKGEFWNDFVDNHLKHPDERVFHAHIYVDTCLHPDPLHTIMYAWWQAKGFPIDRAIDPMSPKPHVGALHGIHPTGYPGFDFFFRYNKDTVLGPMPPELPEAEAGQNKLSWGKKYQDDFLKQFDFKAVGPDEDVLIRNYFQSKHWKETIANIVDPNVMHCHANFKLNFDPKIFELFVSEELKRMGWRINFVVPCVYSVKGVYTGKNVFHMGYPEKVFDTTWKYEPDTVLKPADDAWIYGEDPGFDIWRRPLYDTVLAENPYYTLTDDEVKDVLASFEK